MPMLQYKKLISKSRFPQIAFLIVLLFVSAVGALADVRFESGSSALKIPFRLWNNHIFIQTGVNDSKPLWFLLDTGAVNILNRRNAEAINLKLSPNGQVGGVGEGSVEIWSAENVTFSLPGVKYSSPRITVISLEPVEACSGQFKVDEQGKIIHLTEPLKPEEKLPIDGLLGYEFLKSFVVEIDYEHQFINLCDPKNYNYAGQGDVIPIEFSGVHIFMRAPLTVQTHAFPARRFLIDTGAAPALILNKPFIDLNKLLPPPEQTERIEVCGVGGKTVTQIGTIENLKLKTFNLDNPVTLFSQATAGVLTRQDFDGIIGNAILRRFRVIFDYSRGQMILESGDK